MLEKWGEPKEKVFSRSRKREYVEPRQVIAFVLKFGTKMTLKQIGLVISRDQHSVIHSIKIVINLYQTDKEYRKKIENILNESKIYIPDNLIC